MWDPYYGFERAILPNGLEIFAAHWPDRPSECIKFLVHSGARHDLPSKEGTAHFLEHLVSENTEVPRKEIEKFFDEQGGSAFLGETGFFYTKYGMFVPRSPATMQKALSLFGQILLTASIEKEVEKERGIISEELENKFTESWKKEIVKLRNKVLYPGQWMSRFLTALGDQESLSRITKADLQAYYDTYYVSQNMSIVCVGGYTLSELVDIISGSIFGMEKLGQRVKLSPPLNSTKPPFVTDFYLDLKDYAPGRKSGMYSTMAALPGTITDAQLAIFRMMLNEVLFEEIREKKKWTYGIGCSDNHAYGEIVEFSIFSSSLNLDAFPEIDNSIASCIEAVSRSSELFLRKREKAVLSNLMLDQTADKVCNGAVGDLYRYGRIISVQEWINELKAVSLEDIQQVASYLLPERRLTIVMK